MASATIQVTTKTPTMMKPARLMLNLATTPQKPPRQIGLLGDQPEDLDGADEQGDEDREAR